MIKNVYKNTQEIRKEKESNDTGSEAEKQKRSKKKMGISPNI